MANSPKCKSTQMKKNQMCKTYLIAYSSEDFEVFSMRKSCSLSIAEAFD